MTLRHPAVDAAGPEAQPVFIWDTASHDAREYTLKRRVFIYECALDLDIPIYVGDSYSVLLELAKGQDVFAAETPDPIISNVLTSLAEHLNVSTREQPSFLHVPANTDTGRFFRFWNRSKKSALTHSKDSLIQ